MYIENDNLKLAFDFVQFTGRNIFLTGKAGTGKTTFLKQLKNRISKRVIVVAPTGVAAINAGGVTIHSFFQMPFGPIIPEHIANGDEFSLSARPSRDINRQRFSKIKIDIMRSLDLLVIDEISMVRCDLLDGIDMVLRRIRKNNKAFGGVQLLMIGDLHQLAPVVKEDEWTILREFYPTSFFFSSMALQQTMYLSIELKEIFRQSDIKFINLLNRIRENKTDAETLNELNKRYINLTGFNSDGYITLTTHNYQSQRINDSKLKLLKNKEYCFDAQIKGEFPEYAYPTLEKLILKKDAQVMFVKNDSSPEKQFFNGKIGRITGFDEYRIVVRCNEDEHPIYVVPEKWENIKYEIDSETKEIKEEVVGTFIQYPLKLAWAITIHKSQGLTFDKAIIDANSAFAFGQVYVALSRCRSLEGLILSSPLNSRCIIRDDSVTEFTGNIEKNHPDNKVLQREKAAFRQTLIIELLDFGELRKQVFLIKNLSDLNKSSLNGSFYNSYSEFYHSFNKDIAEVADKFSDRMLHAFESFENNLINQVEERLVKACIYFSENIETLFKLHFGSIELDCDNKEVKKALNESVSNLYHSLYVKTACFKSCIKSFDSFTYLETKNKALLSKETFHIPSGVKGKTASTTFAANPILYKRLKEWRELKARETGLTVNGVLKIKQLENIAEAMPVSFAEFNKSKLLSRNKANIYGFDIINIVMKYKEELQS